VNRGEHREERRLYARKRYAEKRNEILARIRELRALDPEKARKLKREWLARNPDKKKAYSERNTARVKELRRRLRELERIAQNPGLQKDTRLRITVAALLSLDGLSKRAMSRLLFPAQTRRDVAYNNTKVFFRRFLQSIESEKLLVASLSEAERRREAERARSNLMLTARGEQ
jgi:hypothetical protein